MEAAVAKASAAQDENASAISREEKLRREHESLQRQMVQNENDTAANDIAISDTSAAAESAEAKAHAARFGASVPEASPRVGRGRSPRSRSLLRAAASRSVSPVVAAHPPSPRGPPRLFYITTERGAPVPLARQVSWASTSDSPSSRPRVRRVTRGSSCGRIEMGSRARWETSEKNLRLREMLRGTSSIITTSLASRNQASLGQSMCRTLSWRGIAGPPGSVVPENEGAGPVVREGGLAATTGDVDPGADARERDLLPALRPATTRGEGSGTNLPGLAACSSAAVEFTAAEVSAMAMSFATLASWVCSS